MSFQMMNLDNGCKGFKVADRIQVHGSPFVLGFECGANYSMKILLILLMNFIILINDLFNQHID